ncbi:sporangiospore maturation cell wall hydrolase GsmA [Glycomyces sp. L485]|uniref:sporangiospore maturation cell wall hydrolase GsmA n=1 Tax=Glycomyces sp. L485 TaxID=2909235 RepID=UPI001F4B6F4A|nr:sporangiospore maturation cell wall hydrolase GsmA [Glycomyces sp. L485]MCH7230086.1 sporangiospore maturation cell wall hydrolase GsmA [Glycomyces sp. L485]
MGVLNISIRFAMVPVLAAAIMLAGSVPADAKVTGAVVSTSGGSVNVRSGPATDQKVVTALANGATPTVHCKVRGERIDGHVRGSSSWLRVGTDRWVSHAYIRWTDGSPKTPWCAMASKKPTHAKVTTAGSRLNVRAAADSGSNRRGTYDNGATARVVCQVWGQSVDGRVSETNVWYRVGDKNFVSAAYIEWNKGEPWIPWCGQDPPSVPKGGNQAFIDRHASAAQASRLATGVPASVTLAQAILETGWGKGALAREDHNIFGMKCFGSPGDHAIGCRDYGTFECSPTGGCFDINATFRAYDNVGDSYRDHGELLSGWSRYAKAMDHRGDPDRFAREIHKAGYATDPKYSDKLIGIMKQYDLYRYDR